MNWIDGFGEISMKTRHFSWSGLAAKIMSTVPWSAWKPHWLSVKTLWWWTWVDRRWSRTWTRIFPARENSDISRWTSQHARSPFFLKTRTIKASLKSRGTASLSQILRNSLDNRRTTALLVNLRWNASLHLETCQRTAFEWHVAFHLPLVADSGVLLRSIEDTRPELSHRKLPIDLAWTSLSLSLCLCLSHSHSLFSPCRVVYHCPCSLNKAADDFILLYYSTIITFQYRHLLS